MSAQDVFDQALLQYNEAMNLIEQLSVEIRRFQSEFSTEIAKREFDEVLQTILLKLAVADYELSPIELSFIKEITSRGDILIRISNDIDTEISWDQLKNAPLKSVSLVIQAAETLSDDSVKDFALFMSLVDLMHPEIDYGLKFVEHITKIASAFMVIDGEVTDDEKSATGPIILDRFFKVWAAAKAFAAQKLKEEIDKDNPNGTSFTGGKR